MRFMLLYKLYISLLFISNAMPYLCGQHDGVFLSCSQWWSEG